MGIKRRLLAAGAACALAVSTQTSAQQQATAEGPRFTNGNSLPVPADYREWIFLSSGIGMSYDPVVGDPPAGSPAGPGFGNVYVNFDKSAKGYC